LDDRSARLEVSLYEEIFQQHRDIIVKDAILIIDGTLRFDDFIEAWRLQAKIADGYRPCARALCAPPVAALAGEFDGPQGMNRFEQMLKPYLRGSCGVSVAIEPARVHGAPEFGGHLVGAPDPRTAGQAHGLGRARRLVFSVWST
jgi:DNA polymerase-3 subunit alpha